MEDCCRRFACEPPESRGKKRKACGNVEPIHGSIQNIRFSIPLRGLAKIKLPFMAQGFWPLARRERRAYPAHGSVRSEQRSQRPKDQARMGKVILARPLSGRPPQVEPFQQRIWRLAWLLQFHFSLPQNPFENP